MIHKITIKISLLLAFLIMFSFGTTLQAQNQAPFINGVVHDENGKALSGVVVNSVKGNNRTFTDEKGEYSLIINDGSKSVVFSYIGYGNKKVTVSESKQINVNLKPDASNLDEIVQLGYSSQRRGDLSGAVATVTGEELKKSPVANLSMTFDGRLAGLTTQETYSELSRANTNLNIRGLSANRGNGPLVIIDGIISSYNSNQTLDHISPAEIESVTILKDASTQALYGIQGANGIIVITTKRGHQGDLRVNVRLDESLQQVSTKPTFINSATYAKLRNEAASNDGLGQNYFYSDDQIANYASGANRELYPNTNWYDKFMKNFAQMQRVNADFTGGSDKVQYFTNVNIMHQGSQFDTDQPKYDVSPNFTWANIRSNLNAKLNDNLSAYLNIGGNIKRERIPGSNFSDLLYTTLFTMPPTVYGPVTPSYIDPATGKPAGNQVVATNSENNPTYGLLNRSGYTRHTVTNIYAQFGLNLDMNFITEGLSASGVVAYQTNSVNSLYTTQNYERWVRSSDPDTLTFIKHGNETNSPLVYGKGCSFYYDLTNKLMMNYKRDFGMHHVGGMAYMFYQNLTKADNGSPWCLPYNRVNTGLEGTYDYDQRYYLKMDVGYSGSEQYARGHRYTTTPAVSGAWLVSRESFMSDLDWINNLKLRASYGKTANDQSGLGRYAYLDNVTVGGGGPIGSLKYYINELQTGNPTIVAEISTKQNYGIDLGLFNGFSLSVDVFKERMDNMVINATANIPVAQGIPLGNYPATNSGSFENKGYDITASYTKNLAKDLTATIGGFVSFSKNKAINSGEALKAEDYAYRKWSEGYSYGQNFGYIVDKSNGNGFYNSQDEIKSSNLTYDFGTPRVGDLKYMDLNNDGVINEKDKAPIGTGALPRYYYGFNGSVNYKSFDLSFLFQGIGEYKTFEGGMGIFENNMDGIYGSLHQNAWTADRYANGEKITAPALSLHNTVNQEWNNYYLYNRAYLRLKNLEIGYTLPDRISRIISASKVKFLLSGQNLLTWDKMKSDDFGPEGGYSSIPVYRVYNVGLSIQF
ncbi:MAG: SusC/RagA family TonB-linked outer membrane protein [Bacteroidota bacterium]|nr:SusC/RagA family TonB-linked outer membrane protein [Bacteroidota bacterium]